MVTLTLQVFSCYWSGESPFDTKLGTQEDEVKWNTSAKNCAPGMFVREGMCGVNKCSINWLVTLQFFYYMCKWQLKIKSIALSPQSIS